MKRSAVALFLLAFLAFLSAGCGGKAPATSAGGPSVTSGEDASLVVATVNGEKITLGQLDKTLRGQLLNLERQRLAAEHKLRADGLEGMISRKLLLEEAAKRKMSEDDLLRAEVESKVTPPTEADLKSFYDANQERIGDTYQNAKDKIARYLQQQKQQQAFMSYMSSLKSAANVEITLPPADSPFVQVAAVGPARGPASAPVTIVIFSDFQCPYCSRAKAALDEVVKTYGDKVRMVFRDYPMPFHPLAPKASEAAHCADEQGKFWEMHDHLFTHQDKLAVDDLKAAARTIGLDGAKFDQCLDSGRTAAKIAENLSAGQEAGVEGTPAFFINGRMLSGAQPFDAFKQAIDRELKRAGA